MLQDLICLSLNERLAIIESVLLYPGILPPILQSHAA